MPKLFSSRRASFRFAINGLFHAFRTQPNIRIHAVITALVFLAGLILQISRIEWLIIALTIGVVWAAELINTSLEALVDLTSPQQHRLAGIAKDCSAAAVLVTSISAVCVGLIVFLPPIIQLLFPGR